MIGQTVIGQTDIGQTDIGHSSNLFPCRRVTPRTEETLMISLGSMTDRQSDGLPRQPTALHLP